MKNLILAITLLLPLTVWSEPSSRVAWEPEMLNLLKQANPSKGKELAKNCVSCHGENGLSTSPNLPSLAGQLPTYLFKQLQDYADGSRENPLMSGLVKSLSKQDAADLAAWFGLQSKAFSSGGSAEYKQAGNLVKIGSRDRILPPCEVCHGGDGNGQKIDIPGLAGQSADYVIATLKAFKEGSRHNDIYGRMRSIAQSLTDSEIAELGYYYQNVR